MVICRWYGNLNFFIIVIVNSNWVEISDYLKVYDGELVNSWLDLECWVFKFKLDEIMSDFKKGVFFFKLVVGKICLLIWI